MRDSKYLINNRFLVDLQVHQVTDSSTGTAHHLEPRLMEVLFALIKSPGELVARETLIHDIWNDYAGADDGLTQAISSLRKLLSDDTKDIIRTIPKKGYILTATVVKQNDGTPITGRPTRKKVYLSLVGALGVACVLFFALQPADSPQSSRSEHQSTEIAFPSLEKTDETDYLNTITTTDSSGNRYRLTMIGDRRPEFYINDSLQQDTEGYTALVDKLAKELWRRQAEAEQERK